VEEFVKQSFAGGRIESIEGVTGSIGECRAEAKDLLKLLPRSSVTSAGALAA